MIILSKFVLSCGGNLINLLSVGFCYDHDHPPVSDLYKVNLEGQQVIVNKNSKVVILELKEVFRKAGIIFKWKDELGWQAFGVNTSILRLIELGKYKLLINFHSNKSKKEYWIDPFTLRDFVENNNCMKKINGTKIFNIPLALFKEKPIFSGVQNV